MCPTGLWSQSHSSLLSPNLPHFPSSPLSLLRLTHSEQARQPGANGLTYSQLLSKDRPLAQGRAVPAAVAELVLTFVDAELGAFADDDDGVGATLTEGPLTGGQSWYLVADDVCAQRHHRGQRPKRRDRDERHIEDG